MTLATAAPHAGKITTPPTSIHIMATITPTITPMAPASAPA